MSRGRPQTQRFLRAAATAFRGLKTTTMIKQRRQKKEEEEEQKKEEENNNFQAEEAKKTEPVQLRGRKTHVDERSYVIVAWNVVDDDQEEADTTSGVKEHATAATAAAAEVGLPGEGDQAEQKETVANVGN